MPLVRGIIPTFDRKVSSIIDMIIVIDATSHVRSTGVPRAPEDEVVTVEEIERTTVIVIVKDSWKLS